MPTLLRDDLPFAVRTDGARDDGLFADIGEDGTVASIGFWRDGRRLAGLVLDGEGARFETVEHFEVFSESDDPSDPDGFKAWLDGTAFTPLKDLADWVKRCAFCGKQSTEVKTLVMGPVVGICNECVALSTEILAEQKSGGG